MRKCVAALAALTLPGLAMSAPAFAQPEGTTLTLVVGAGRAAFSGDGGPAAQARLNRPLAAAAGADGSLYVADTLNRRVRLVDTGGAIRTVAGNGEQSPPDGPIPGGTKGTDIALAAPNTVAVAVDGTVFIADTLASRVYALAADGTLTLRVDPELLGGPIATINAMTVTPDGTIVLADRENSRIVEIPPGDGSRPVSTPVPLPIGLAADTAGDVWIAGATSQLSRLHEGEVATIVESPDGGWQADEKRPSDSPFNARTVSAGADGAYIVDNVQRTVRRLGTDGTVSTVATLAVETFGEGDPVTLAAGAAPSGPLYLVDTTGSRVFSAPVAASTGNAADGDAAPVRLWIAGGAAVIVLLGVVAVVARRRRA